MAILVSSKACKLVGIKIAANLNITTSQSLTTNYLSLHIHANNIEETIQ